MAPSEQGEGGEMIPFVQWFRVNRVARYVLVAVIAFTIGGTGIVIGGGLIPSPDGTIWGCYQASNGALRLVGGPTECKGAEVAIRWNQTGPAGATGAVGPQGPSGAQGPTGPAGATGAQGVAGAARPPRAPGPAGAARPPRAPGGAGPGRPAGAPGGGRNARAGGAARAGGGGRGRA